MLPKADALLAYGGTNIVTKAVKTKDQKKQISGVGFRVAIVFILRLVQPASEIGVHLQNSGSKKWFC
jgi:hypothetical protein